MKTKQKSDAMRMKTTVVFGYALFTAIALIEIINILLITNSVAMRPVDVRQRIATLFILMSLAMLLPLLIAYVAGDRATKIKSKLEHHYNGIVFGLTAFWLWLFSTMFSFSLIPVPNIPFIPVQIAQFWPSFIVIGIMIAIGVWYMVIHKQRSLLNFKPLQVALLGSILGFLIFGMLNTFRHPSQSRFFNELLPFVAVGIMYLVSYARSAATTRQVSTRLTDAGVSTTIGVLAMTISGQIVSRLQNYSSASILLSVLIGVGVWLGYLHVAQHSRKK